MQEIADPSDDKIFAFVILNNIKWLISSLIRLVIRKLHTYYISTYSALTLWNKLCIKEKYLFI